MAVHFKQRHSLWSWILVAAVLVAVFWFNGGAALVQRLFS
jgi:hypothetical protein